MTPADLRNRRKALRLTQADFAERLGLHRDSVGAMERGIAPIEPRTAAAAMSLRPAPLDRAPTMRDDLERRIEMALIAAGIDYRTDQDGQNQSALDFYLPAFDTSIEVKRFHSDRTGEQMKRALNVIAVQGELAVNLLAQAIRSGDFLGFVAEANRPIRRG